MKMPQKPPHDVQLLQGIGKPEHLARIFEVAGNPDSDARYFHWDELRFRKPPEELTHEEWWAALKIRRRAAYKEIPLTDKTGSRFRFYVPEFVNGLLHEIDRGSGTFVQIPRQITNRNLRNRFVVRSLMEEAITSSQLEGAATTREVAKKMLIEGRPPRNQSERMIANNYATMRRILEIKAQPLTPELVFQIHREISHDALDTEEGSGRFRRSDETINVSSHDGAVFHVPPAADELSGRLEKMCDFANAKTPEFFIHPVIRGILLHFWLAYDHPFVDGNGRTARALFYWQMLHSDYWLFEFISISHFLRKAPVQYGEAFLYTETDENDLTYFLIHQIEIIRKALKEFSDYFAKASAETHELLHESENYPELNLRQQTLISHAIRHPGFIYDIVGHQTRHGITYATARSDLLKLAKSKLLEQRKTGRAFAFLVPKDLATLLKSKP